MKRIFTLMVMLCFFVQHTAKAQINGQQPGTALSICDASALSIGTVPGYNGGGLPNSCLAAGALNPFWYTFTVNASGTIGFTITPNNSYDDYDFAVYDISNTSPSNAANAPLVSCNYSGYTGASTGYTGVTGCTPSGTGSFNGAYGNNQNQLINVTAGQTFALIVSHYTSSNQSGYDLQFTGGSVTPSPLPPAMDAVSVTNCNQKLNVVFNQSVKCSSIASNGSDFYLMPGNITIPAASGFGCGSSTFTNQAVLTLPNNIATGNYTLHVKNGTDGNTVTDVCGNNIPTTNLVNFIVSPAPPPGVAFSITSADTQCLYNNSFVFDNTSTVSLGTMTYAWAFGDNGTATFTDGTHTYGAAGNYTVKLTATTNQGCIDSVKHTLAVLASPGVPAKVSPVNYCLGETPVAVSATPSANNTINWYSSPTGGTASTTAPVPSTAVAGTYTFYVSQTLTTTGCEGPRDSIKVIVKPLPAALTAGSNTPVCSKDTVKLTSGSSSTGITYAWTGPNGFTSSLQNPTVDSATMAADGTYKVVMTLNGCKDSTTTVVVMKQTPYNLTASSNTPVCSDALNVLHLFGGSSNPAATYSWTGPNGYTSNVQNPNSSPVSVTMAGTYKATVSANGCSDTVSTVVAINQTPVGLTASNSGPVCSGPAMSVQLFAGTTTTGTPSYSWTGPNGYTSNQQNPTITGLTVANSGKYICTVTLGTCSDTVSTMVTVKQTPVGLTASSNSPVCSGPANSISLQSATTTPGAVTYSWTGPNTYTANVQNPVINAAAANMSGKYIATVTLNGCSDTVSTLVTVNQTPTAPTAADTVWYCNNGTATALTATGLNLKWYTAIGGTASTTAPVPSTATVGATTYYVSQTSAAGCESPLDSIKVVVKPNPARPTVTTPIAYCLNDVPVALIATAATGGTLNWYTSIGGAASSTTPVPSTATVNTYKWYVSQTVIGCEGPVDSIQVTVKPLPAPPAVGSNTPVCSGTGNTLNLTASSTSTGVTYAWTGPNSYTSTSQNPSITAPTTAATGKYIVTVTLNGCIRKDSVNVLINQTPVAPTVVPTIAYCQYLPTTVLSATAATGNILKWYTSNTSATPLATAPTPSSQVPGTYTWYVSQTSPQGCEGPRASIAVTIKPKPTVPVVTPLYTYCQFENVPALTANGQNLLWYAGPAGGLGSPAAPVPSTLVPTTTTFFVSQTINGCEGDRDSIKVTVLPKPAPPVVVTPISYCQYSAAQPLTATGTGLKWYTTPTGGLGATVAPVPNTGYEDTISYWVSQTVNGCESDRMRLDVIVNYQPNGIITATSANICQYALDTFNYFGNARPDALYDWSSLFKASTLVSGSGQGPVVVRFDSVGAITVRLRVDNKGCVSPEAVFTVNVAPAPVVRITAKDEACQNESVMVAMNYASIPVTKFNWTFDGGQLQWGADAGPLGIVWKTPGKHVVTLTATTDSKCKSLPSVDTVLVHPLPAARILSASATNVCTGDSILLRAATPDSGTVYTWSPVMQFGGLEAPAMQEVYAKIIASGAIKLTATNEFGCKAADSIIISVKPCCQIYFPDAFTPNNDGRNDLFRPITTGHHEISSFRVANRYGQVVFETADEERSWDGTFGGVDQPIGTYYYYIKYKCDGKYMEEKGEITLVR